MAKNHLQSSPVSVPVVAVGALVGIRFKVLFLFFSLKLVVDVAIAPLDDDARENCAAESVQVSNNHCASENPKFTD